MPPAIAWFAGVGVARSVGTAPPRLGHAKTPARVAISRVVAPSKDELWRAAVDGLFAELGQAFR
jgi:hypothetical protein